MSPTRAPTLRELATGARPRPAPIGRRDHRALIFADPDLAPSPRRETPLTAFA